MNLQPHDDATTVTIAARQSWINTGIRLEAHQTYMLTAEGEWTDRTMKFTPDGRRLSSFTLGDLVHAFCVGLGKLESFYRWATGENADFYWTKRVEKYGFFTLLGCLGREGEPPEDAREAFLVGRYRVYTPTKAGQLYCFANDVAGFYGNNSGSVKLTVRKRQAADSVEFTSASKNIVLCCDGTNNQFGSRNTNVVRLIQCLDLNSPGTNQLVFYDPGVGTLESPNLVTWVGRKLSRFIDLGFGAGVEPNVLEAVTFLSRNYEPGDRVYIFGFSRGAYTARAIAGLVHKCGLPLKDSDNLRPYLMRIYRDTQDWAVSDQFKTTFGRPCRIHFLGLWDTVSSVGHIWNPKSYQFTANNPDVEIVRHAVSLDERRSFFRTNLWRGRSPGQDVQEVWFPGVHSDIGGGYEEDQYPDSNAMLWKVSFDWMQREAAAAGLKFDASRVQQFLGGPATQVGVPWHATRMHESNVGLWVLCKFIPKLVYNYSTQRREFKLGLDAPRYVPDGASLHPAVIERLADPAYRPANLDPSYLEKVRTDPAPKPPAFPFYRYKR